MTGLLSSVHLVSRDTPTSSTWSRARKRAVDHARKGVRLQDHALTGMIHCALTGATPAIVHSGIPWNLVRPT